MTRQAARLDRIERTGGWLLTMPDGRRLALPPNTVEATGGRTSDMKVSLPPAILDELAGAKGPATDIGVIRKGWARALDALLANSPDVFAVVPGARSAFGIGMELPKGKP